MSDPNPPTGSDSHQDPPLAHLRTRLIKGGASLFAGQLGEHGLKLIGLYLITRVLGPENYAAFLTAMSIYLLGIVLVRDGMQARLVVASSLVLKKQEQTVYSLAVLLSLVFFGASWLASDWVEAIINVPGAGTVLWVLVLATPLQLLNVPAIAALHRSLSYPSMAVIDVSSQAVYYATAVPLVINGAGAAGLAYAFVFQHTFRLIAAHWCCHKIPVFSFEIRTAVEICRFGFSYSLIGAIWQARGLLPLLIVGHWLGAYAVGTVGMAATIVELVSFAKSIGFKIYLTVFGRITTEVEELRRSVSEAVRVQTLIVGAMLLGFGFVGEWIVPIAFGARWLPILDLYPFIGLSCLVNAFFIPHSAALVRLDRNVVVAAANALNVGLLAAVSAISVPTLGLVGYGFAEIASLPAYATLHFLLARKIGSPDYRLAGWWLTAAAVGLFWRELGVWAIAIPFLALATPHSLRYLRSIATSRVESPSR